MKALSTAFCAMCAAFGLTISATAETETIAYWPFGTNGFHDAKEAMVRSWEMDKDALVASGFAVNSDLHA